MELLTDDQQARIWQAIQGPDNRMALELYDHFCCYVESQLQQGQSFDASLQSAVQAIAPDGVAELEAEFASLLAYQPQPQMKRLFYLSTFTGTFFLCFSVLARSWNWIDGTQVTELAGNATFLLVVFPVVVALSIRNFRLLTRLDLVRMALGVSAGSLICLGRLFKALYFPYANALFNSGMVLLLFAFLPIFFFQLYRRAYV